MMTKEMTRTALSALERGHELCMIEMRDLVERTHWREFGVVPAPMVGRYCGAVADMPTVEVRARPVRDLWFVNEYLTNKGYGGPEEGGWWYDTGEFVRCHGVFASAEMAAGRMDELSDYVVCVRRRYDQKPAHSIGCSGWTVLQIDEQPGADYPRVRPHYE